MRQQVGDMNVLVSCREEVGGERPIKRKLGPQTGDRATSSLFPVTKNVFLLMNFRFKVLF